MWARFGRCTGVDDEAEMSAEERLLWLQEYEEFERVVVELREQVTPAVLPQSFIDYILRVRAPRK